MTIFPLDANRQNVDMLQRGQAPANAQNPVYRSTGSKLLDSLKHHNTVSTATVLFGVDTANGLGLQHLEIPALNSTAFNSTALNTRVSDQGNKNSTAPSLAVILGECSYRLPR